MLSSASAMVVDMGTGMATDVLHGTATVMDQTAMARAAAAAATLLGSLKDPSSLQPAKSTE